MKYLLGLLFFAAIVNSEGSEFTVRITPSASEISIKDTLTVQLDFTYPEGYQLDLDAIRHNILRDSSFYDHPFSLVDLTPQTKDGTKTEHIVVTLQPLRIGHVFLTFYDIPFISKDKTHKVISEIFPIQVLPIQAPPQFQGVLEPLLTFSKTFPYELDEHNQNNLIKDSEIQNRENLLNEQYMKNKRFPWIKITCVLLIVFAFWIFHKYPYVKPPLTPEQIAKEAQQKALLDLQQLRSKNLPEKGFFDQFYVELTNPVRAYIERKYHLPASTSTTPEFLAEAAKNPAFSSQIRKELSEFLIQADKVKFGRYHPSIEESNHALEVATQLIKSES